MTRCAWCGKVGDLVWIGQERVWLHNDPKCAAGYWQSKMFGVGEQSCGLTAQSRGDAAQPEDR